MIQRRLGEPGVRCVAGGPCQRSPGLANNTSALELLREAQTAWANGLRHQFTPLADIQHHQGTSSQALFNTCMSYRSEGRVDDSVVPNASIALDFISGHDPSEFDVTINVGASRTGNFEAQPNYRAARMTAEQAANMAYALRRAVDCALDFADNGSRGEHEGISQDMASAVSGRTLRSALPAPELRL